MSDVKVSRPPNLDGLIVRKLTWDDIDDFVEFYKSEGHLDQTIESFKWQYCSVQKEVKDIFVAEPIDSSDRAKYIFAAVYCISQRKFLSNSQENMGALSLQTLTGEKYRSRGLFTHLAKMCYEQAKVDGVKFVYGSPNDNSMPSFLNHLSWSKLPNINVLAKFNPFQLVKGKMGFRNRSFDNAKGKILEVKSYHQPMDNLWKEFSKKIELGLVRGGEYWNWRFLQRPNSSDRVYVFENNNGEALAACAIGISNKKEGKRGYIMDFMVHPAYQYEGKLLLKWCCNQLFNQGCIIVVTCQSNGNPYKKILKDVKFRRIPKYFHPPGPRLALTVLDESCKSVLNNPDKWHITYGDYDVL